MKTVHLSSVTCCNILLRIRDFSVAILRQNIGYTGYILLQSPLIMTTLFLDSNSPYRYTTVVT